MWIDALEAIDMAFKGLVIGIASSAPMGPSGVLSVQRTLNKGRWYGFATGIGVACSDLIYALMAGLGLNFLMDIISRPAAGYWLQLTGTLLLFFFGWYVFYSKPSRRIQPASKHRGSLFHNATTGFLLTFSNPLIIFLYLTLFAQFNFIEPERVPEQVVGFVCLFLGALLWWYFLSFAISKVGNRFRHSGLVWLNRTIGVVVMVVSILALYLTLRGRVLY